MFFLPFIPAVPHSLVYVRTNANRGAVRLAASPSFTAPSLLLSSDTLFYLTPFLSLTSYSEPGDFHTLSRLFLQCVHCIQCNKWNHQACVLRCYQTPLPDPAFQSPLSILNPVSNPLRFLSPVGPVRSVQQVEPSKLSSPTLLSNPFSNPA